MQHHGDIARLEKSVCFIAHQAEADFPLESL